MLRMQPLWFAIEAPVPQTTQAARTTTICIFRDSLQLRNPATDKARFCLRNSTVHIVQQAVLRDN